MSQVRKFLLRELYKRHKRSYNEDGRLEVSCSCGWKYDAPVGEGYALEFWALHFVEAALVEAYELEVYKVERSERVTSEPGADTGITPPLDVWTCEACGYKSDDIGEYREVCGKCFSAAAERGTTPPEGLESALRGVMPFMRYQSVFDYDAYQAAIAEVSRVLAATQRAPVEQGRDSRPFEEVIQLHIDSSESMLGVFQRTGDAPGAGMQRGVTAGLKRAIEVYGNWSARQAAPDHAREGALREALELAKGALANGSTIDQRYETYKIVCEALADGKEGGE